MSSHPIPRFLSLSYLLFVCSISFSFIIIIRRKRIIHLKGYRNEAAVVERKKQGYNSR